MKTIESVRVTLLLVLLLAGLAACNDEDDLRLSPHPEYTMEGRISTLRLEMTRSDWRIASITSLGGVLPDGGNIQLDGPGTVHYRWATIKREGDNLLTIEADDNFDGEERGFILNLEMKTGFYKEQVTVRQAVCTDFYQVKSIAYSIEEGDGVEEAEPQLWKVSVYDHTGEEGGSWTSRYWPFYNENVIYSFQLSEEEQPSKYINPEEGIEVDMPKGIGEDGSIVYENEKRPFGSWKTYDCEQKETAFEVEQFDQKLNIYSADIYYKQLQLSYVLTLYRPGNHAGKSLAEKGNTDEKNKEDGTEKGDAEKSAEDGTEKGNTDEKSAEDGTERTFSGKLVKRYPYGCSSIRHEVSDLPPEE